LIGAARGAQAPCRGRFGQADDFDVESDGHRAPGSECEALKTQV
jgi:hypothetical protein